MTTPAAGVRGGFHADGSWNAEGWWSTPLEKFVLGLVRMRRSSRFSPAQFAETIGGGEYASAFGAATLEQWAGRREFDDWPAVMTETGAGEHVKRCGQGISRNTRYRWVQGWYVHSTDVDAAWRRLRDLGQESLDLGRSA